MNGLLRMVQYPYSMMVLTAVCDLFEHKSPETVEDWGVDFIDDLLTFLYIF